MKSIYPKPLRPGDRICVIDPANAFTEEGMEGAREYLEKKGFEVTFSKDMAFRHGSPKRTSVHI